MTAATAKNGKAKAFSVIFLLEFWERFGFYGMLAILTIYFVNSLHMSDAEAVMTYGAFSALCYGLVAVGGFIGDKYVGTKRTILLGLAFLTAGYFILAFSGGTRQLIYAGLAAVAVGNGFFKANPSSLVSKLYDGEPAKVESAFTLYYMAINLGSFFSMLITPWTSSRWSDGVSYGVCAVSLVIAAGIFSAGYRLLKNCDSTVGKSPLNRFRLICCIGGGIITVALCTWLLSNLAVCNWLVAAIGTAALAYFGYEIISSRGLEQRKMLVALILMLEAVVFFTLYNQMPTSVNLFTIRNTDHAIFFGLLTLDPLQFQSFNSFWVVALSPVLAWLYNRAGQRGEGVSMPWKFAWGMLLCAGGFLVLSFSSLFAHNGLVSGDWVNVSYFLQSFGELLISGLGLAMVAQLVPQRMQGFIMGVWFLANTAASIIGGLVAALASVPEGVTNPLQTLPVYVDVFNKIGFVTLAIFVITAFATPWLSRMIKARVDE